MIRPVDNDSVDDADNDANTTEIPSENANNNITIINIIIINCIVVLLHTHTHSYSQCCKGKTSGKGKKCYRKPEREREQSTLRAIIITQNWNQMPSKLFRKYLTVHHCMMNGWHITLNTYFMVQFMPQIVHFNRFLFFFNAHRNSFR